jgi:hypothetical protein
VKKATEIIENVIKDYHKMIEEKEFYIPSEREITVIIIALEDLLKRMKEFKNER